MFIKANMRDIDLEIIQRLIPKDSIYGMHIDADRYHIYHVCDHSTMSDLMIFWSKSGLEVSGSVSFEQGLKAKTIHFSIGHSLEQWSPLDWYHILPESLYRRLTEKDIQHLEPLELQAALNEIYARRGMRFLDDHTSEYFIQQSWYEDVIDEDAFNEDMLSDVERYNIAFLERHMEPLFFIA